MSDPSGAPGPILAVTPPPGDDEVAAIVAAVRLLLQRPEARRAAPVRSGWRFAGRWWR